MKPAVTAECQEGHSGLERPVLPMDLVAGPAKPNPPMTVAIAIVGASLCAPILFLRTGAPSPWLGVATLALAGGGVIAICGAINGRRRVHDDPEIRVRARIGVEGITLYQTPAPASGQFFPAHQIAEARLFSGSLVVVTTETHAAPGRYALRLGKAVSRHQQISAALLAVTRSG